MPLFQHPLARDAQIWRSAGLAGQAQPILVIITPIELNPKHSRFSEKNFARLTAAAQEWIQANEGEASDYLLMNRPKTWAGDKD